MCEIYMEGTDEAVAKDIFQIVNQHPGAIMPKLVDKVDGHKAVTVAFSNPRAKQDIEDVINAKYKGRVHVSFR